MEATENSFVKQSLSDTLLKNGGVKRSASSSRPRRMLNIKEMTSRKAKADEDTGGILKSLGLTPTPRRISNQSMIEIDGDGADWEQVGSERGSDDRDGSNSTCVTPKAPKLPAGPEDFLKHTETQQGAITNATHHGSPKSLDGETLSSLRRKLADSEKAREDLLARNRRLERELAEVKDHKLRPDGKTLGAREYEELEKQFDAQEKVSDLGP